MTSLNNVDSEQATVFVVDDDDGIRQTISLMLRSLKVRVKTYSNAREFLDFYTPDLPGCLLLDMRMPGITGFQLQTELNELGVQLPIIFVSAHGEIPSAAAAMRAGALDFIPKPFSPQYLLERIHEALAVDAKRRSAAAMRQQIQRRLDLLTDRECEVMQRLAQGMSTKVIAARLGISSKTVDNHRAKILEKMEVDNTTQLAVLYSNLQPSESRGDV